jgi:hypothetical protein
MPKRETLRAAALLAAVLLAFFARPIVRFGDSYYSSADASQSSSLTLVDPEHPPSNRLLGDPALQMQPWSMFNRDEVRAGRIPLWNPYNGAGSPHLANYQSAVFSPFNVPFYLIGVRAALIATAFLKLFGLGLFTFLFLRALRLAWWPAIVGATAYMLCAQNIILLAYPHTGAMCALPAGLYCAESACATLSNARGEPAERRRARRWALAGVTLSLAAGLLAGAPETFYYSVLLVGAYVGARLSRWSIDQRGDRVARWRAARLAFGFVVAGALAVCIAAAQVVPFFEYLSRSAVVVDATRSWAYTLSAATWPLFFFPNLLGNPTLPWCTETSVPPPSFAGAASVYTGASILLLALVSVGWLRRRRAHAFFAATTVLWALWAYDAFGWAHRLTDVLPALALAPINHSHHVGVFGLCVCASFALDHIALEPAAFSRPRLAALAAIGIAFAAVFWWGADAYGPANYPDFRPGAEAIAAIRREGLALTVLFGCAWSIALVLPGVRAQHLRTLLWSALLVLVILPCGWLLRAYNPTLPERFFFPRTRAIAALEDAVGDERVVVIGTDTIAPDANLPHRLRMLTSYDALMIDAYARLYRALFGTGYGLRPSIRAAPAALRLFGARFLLAPSGWNPAASHFAGVDWYTKSAFVLGEILPDSPAAYAFTVTRNRLRSIRLPVLTRRRVNRCRLRIRLTDVGTGSIIAEREFACEEWGVPLEGSQDVVLAFDPITDSRGKRYELSISSPDARPGSAVSLWANRRFREIEESAARHDADSASTAFTPGSLTYAGVAVDGGLAHDWSCASEDFRSIATIGPLELYRDDRGCSRYHVVDRARPADSPSSALKMVLDPEFDPRESVVISSDDASPPAETESSDVVRTRATAASSVRVLSEEPGRVELELARDRPGYLVLAIPWYPGWKATVDGSRAPMLRANYAFSAVAMHAGAKSVVLEFAPDSFRWGAWVSAAGLLVALGLALTPGAGGRSARPWPARSA